ncbi:MAG: Holliday junction resolvase RuvX [Parcubacteria group bacterium]
MSIYSQNLPKISHYLGIDFGTAKIGLALADMEMEMAFIYQNIANDKKMLENLAKIVEKENIKKIIIGKSGKLAGSNVAQKSFNIEEIGKKIEKELGVPVLYHEEMFTTKMAQDNLKERGEKNIKKYDDREAARIILQDWLDKIQLSQVKAG